jgi:hypothetical protein
MSPALAWIIERKPKHALVFADITLVVIDTITPVKVTPIEKEPASTSAARRARGPAAPDGSPCRSVRLPIQSPSRHTCTPVVLQNGTLSDQ